MIIKLFKERIYSAPLGRADVHLSPEVKGGKAYEYVDSKIDLKSLKS